MNDQEETAATIIALEEASLARWGKGDPSGFLEICDEDVVYFDPFLSRRLDGLKALTAYYDSLRGQVKIDKAELINPKVQLCSDAAVLTFNFVSYNGETQAHWNCTEVYRRKNKQWRIIQTHWSFTNVGRHL